MDVFFYNDGYGTRRAGLRCWRDDELECTLARAAVFQKHRRSQGWLHRCEGLSKILRILCIATAEEGIKKIRSRS